MLGTWDKRTANNQRIMTNQIQQVVKLLRKPPVTPVLHKSDF